MSSEDEGEDEEVKNQFERLPDDAVLHIFNKLLEAKWLCRCSIASKRFASLIPRVHTIFVPTRLRSQSDTPPPPPPPPPPEKLKFPEKLFKFLVNDVVAKPFRFLHRSVAATNPRPLPPPPSTSGVLKYLSQFEEIQSLHFDIQPRSGVAVGCGRSLFKWGSKFGTKLETCTFLSLTSVHRMNETTENELSVTVNNIGADESKRRVYLAFECLRDASQRHELLVSFIRNHPTLQSVAVTDMKNLGARLWVRGERLAQLRKLAKSTELETTLRVGVEELRSLKVRWCHLPVLRLPHRTKSQ